MSDFRHAISAPVDHVPLFSGRFVLRLTLSALLTSLDAGVIATCGVTLYRVSTNHPFWLIGLMLLSALLLGSLLRVWMLALRSQVR